MGFREGDLNRRKEEEEREEVIRSRCFSRISRFLACLLACPRERALLHRPKSRRLSMTDVELFERLQSRVGR